MIYETDGELVIKRFSHPLLFPINFLTTFANLTLNPQHVTVKTLIAGY